MNRAHLTTRLMSDVVAARTKFFRCIEKAEQELGCQFDDQKMERVIDHKHPDKKRLTDEEAAKLMEKSYGRGPKNGNGSSEH